LLRASGLLAFGLALGSSSLLSGTLCVGDDGHIAIEVAKGGKCVDGAVVSEAPIPFEASPRLTSAAPDSDCGPCIDLTATSGERLAGAKLPQADPGPALAMAAFSGAVSAHSPLVWAASPERPHAARSVLRGTVLRF
jgi:hypothetical protein